MGKLPQVRSSIFWPNPVEPRIEKRRLFVQKRLVWVEVEVLLPERLYIVRKGQGAGEHMFPRSGSVLSRNLDLTRQNGGKVSDRNTHHFLLYKNIHSAIRGIGKIHDRYERIEIPELKEHQDDMRWLLETSWTLHRATTIEEVGFVAKAADIALALDKVRDELKLTVKDRMLRTTDTHGPRKGKNTGRLPPMIWSSSMKLDKRLGNIDAIDNHMDIRLAVLVHYLDEVYKLIEECDRHVQHVRVSGPTVGPTRTKERRFVVARRARNFADKIGQVAVRPAGQHVIRHASDIDLHELALALEEDRIEDVHEICDVVHRSCRLVLDFHRQLEQILIVVTRLRDWKLDLDLVNAYALYHELVRIQTALSGSKWDKGFRNPVVDKVVEAITMTIYYLVEENGPYVKTMCQYLDAACVPF